MRKLSYFSNQMRELSPQWLKIFPRCFAIADWGNIFEMNGDLITHVDDNSLNSG